MMFNYSDIYGSKSVDAVVLQESIVQQEDGL